MKKILWLLLLVVAVTSCRKETASVPSPLPPAMNYVNFNDRQIKFNQSFSVDLNGDNINDIYFNTLLVGDPLLKRDYRQYYVSSSIFTALPVNNNEHIPQLAKGAPVSASSFHNYAWYNASNILLAQKVIEENGQTLWDGQWKTAAHQYIPLQVAKNNLLYYGWAEISFDMLAENIILHRGAVSTEAGKEVKAGL